MNGPVDWPHNQEKQRPVGISPRKMEKKGRKKYAAKLKEETEESFQWKICWHRLKIYEGDGKSRRKAHKHSTAFWVSWFFIRILNKYSWVLAMAIKFCDGHINQFHIFAVPMPMSKIWENYGKICEIIKCNFSLQFYKILRSYGINFCLS